jgi:hypothetical protein
MYNDHGDYRATDEDKEYCDDNYNSITSLHV